MFEISSGDLGTYVKITFNYLTRIHRKLLKTNAVFNYLFFFFFLTSLLLIKNTKCVKYRHTFNRAILYSTEI